MFSFPMEPTSFAETLARRKEAARNTIRETSVAELRTLVTELYPDVTHPFAETFLRFIEEHSTERVFRGEVPGGIGFVYYPKSKNGIWYQYAGKLASVGRLGPNGLKALAEIMAERGHS